MQFCPHCRSTLEELPWVGRVRKVCLSEGCGFVHWDNPLPVVAAIVQHEQTGRILLARNAAWPMEFYGLITGFLERGESPQEAVAREVKEETDLDVFATSLVGVYPFQRKNELIIAFHVRARGEIRLSEELASYKLIAPEKLYPWEGGTGDAVRDWLVGWRGSAPPPVPVPMA